MKNKTHTTGFEYLYNTNVKSFKKDKIDGIRQDINYYTELIAKTEPLLKHWKVMLEQAHKQLEKLEAANENTIY
jgi:hypothetical protein